MGGFGNGRKKGSTLSKGHKQKISQATQRRNNDQNRENLRQEQHGREQFVSLHFGRNNSTNNTTTNNDSIANSNDAPVQEELVGDNPIATVANPTPIVANLDAPADDDPDQDDEDDDGNKKKSTGIMPTYIEAIQNRIRHETSDRFPVAEKKWLIEYLTSHDWWIRAIDRQLLCNKLKLKFGVEDNEDAYFRDIYVWLPDLRWGKACMPTCFRCKTNHYVRNNGFRENHFGRVVITLDDHYHCLSRRYRCKVCEEKAKAIVANYSNLAENQNLRASFEALESQYSFMAWNKRVLPLYANGLGDEFPAFLTWRAGVDKLLLDLMRPLYDKGLRPEALSDTLLELHSKRYHQEYRKRELKIVKMSTLSGKKGVLFSDFTDKRRYNGRCPTGRYLQMVYKTYHSAIKDFLDREVKKRGATRIHIDASYKEAKHLCQYHGENLFKGLITATNEFGEIRLQFHVVTDDHEQFLPAFNAFLKTIQEYGQPEVELLSTDNVAGDRNFYLEILPSLRQSQARVDALAATAETEDENENRLPYCTYDKDNVTTLDGRDIVTAIHALINDKSRTISNLVLQKETHLATIHPAYQYQVPGVYR